MGHLKKKYKLNQLVLILILKSCLMFFTSF